eukprot:1276467-Pyramimonas_sp.AAC.1
MLGLRPSARPRGCSGGDHSWESRPRRWSPGSAPGAREAIPTRRSHHPLLPFPIAARGPPKGCRPRGSTQSGT